MITKIKDWKIFENNKFNTSMDAFELYNILKPMFTPGYIDRPSGHFSDTIDIGFKSTTKYADVKNIIKNANWYLQLINNGEIRDMNFNDYDVVNLTIKPIYSDHFIKIPKYLYHFSPSSNDDSILMNGILPKTGGKKGIMYPPRIHLSIDIDTIKNILKEMNYSVDSNEWTVWEINTTKLNIDKLYIDETVRQLLYDPTACYIQNMTITIDTISIIEQIIL